MKNLLRQVVIIGLLGIASTLNAQELYTYSKTPGSTIDFGWDHVSLKYMCGDKEVEVKRDQTSTACDGRLYPVTWTGGSVKLGTDVTASIRYQFRIIKTGSSGINIPATGPGTYQFTIPTAGKYVIWGNVAGDTTGSMDSFYASMDGTEITWHTGSGVTGQWSWINVTLPGAEVATPGQVMVYDLTAGQHTFILREREAGTQINGLVVVPEGAATIEGETQVIQGGTEANSVVTPVSFGAGIFRFEVQTIQVWNGVERKSAFARSDDPKVATTAGVAKGWIVSVADVPPVLLITPGEAVFPVGVKITK